MRTDEVRAWGELAMMEKAKEPRGARGLKLTFAGNFCHLAMRIEAPSFPTARR
jgi:hypothetical protein